MRLILAALVLFAARVVSGEPVDSIELLNQFGDSVQVLPTGGRTTLVIYSDRDGAAATALWRDALAHGNCRLIEAANLRSAPAVARPFIRRAFRKHAPVLMDWRGELAQGMGFANGQANLYLIDGESETTVHFHGDPTAADLDRLQALIDEWCRHDD